MNADRYQALLAFDPTGRPASEVGNAAGELLASAVARHDHAGLTLGISLADLVLPDVVPELACELWFHVGNAHAALQDLRSEGRESRQGWRQAARERAVIAYRQSILSPAFPALDATRRSQALTNLANELDELGRYIEAIELWNVALQKTPRFGMARGNRGLGLATYAALFPLHGLPLLQAAHDDLTSAAHGPLDNDAGSVFAMRRDEIAHRVTPKRLAGRVDLDTPPRAYAPAEARYREFVLRNGLFLHPLNELGAVWLAAKDDLRLPGMVVPISTPYSFAGFFTQLKQEYVGARLLYYEAAADERPHMADRDVHRSNTLDHPAYGIREERLRASYRLAYSLFDKIGGFLTRYLDLPAQDHLSFTTLWYTDGDHHKGIKPALENRHNPSLRALFGIANDLASTRDGDRQPLLPDAQSLLRIRHELEHGYLKLHTRGFLDAAPARAKSEFADHLALSLNVQSFEDKVLRVLRMARAALLYLSSSIRIEEHDRKAKRSPDELIPPLNLPPIPET